MIGNALAGVVISSAVVLSLPLSVVAQADEPTTPEGDEWHLIGYAKDG